MSGLAWCLKDLGVNAPRLGSRQVDLHTQLYCRGTFSADDQIVSRFTSVCKHNECHLLAHGFPLGSSENRRHPRLRSRLGLARSDLIKHRRIRVGCQFLSRDVLHSALFPLQVSVLTLHLHLHHSPNHHCLNRHHRRRHSDHLSFPQGRGCAKEIQLLGF